VLTVGGGALRDVGHELYQGVLYFQNVIWFYGSRVNVIPLTAIKAAWPALTPIFTKFVNVGQRHVQVCDTKFRADPSGNRGIACTVI